MKTPRLRSARWMMGLFLAAACDDDGIDLERMIDQHKYEPYEANPFFADGRTSRRPPPGTVHRAALLGPPELRKGTRGDAYVTAIPLPVTREMLDRGRNRFQIFCAVCHGLAGDGRSQVAENMVLRPPPSLHEPSIRDMEVGRLFRVISEGYGLMPSYSEELAVEDRWAVVAYVQALELSQNARVADLPPALREEASRWLK